MKKLYHTLIFIAILFAACSRGNDPQASLAPHYASSADSLLKVNNIKIAGLDVKEMIHDEQNRYYITGILDVHGWFGVVQNGKLIFNTEYKSDPTEMDAGYGTTEKLFIQRIAPTVQTKKAVAIIRILKNSDNTPHGKWGLSIYDKKSNELTDEMFDFDDARKADFPLFITAIDWYNNSKITVSYNNKNAFLYDEALHLIEELPFFPSVSNSPYQCYSLHDYAVLFRQESSVRVYRREIGNKSDIWKTELFTGLSAKYRLDSSHLSFDKDTLNVHVYITNYDGSNQDLKAKINFKTGKTI